MAEVMAGSVLDITARTKCGGGDLGNCALGQTAHTCALSPTKAAPATALAPQRPRIPGIWKQAKEEDNGRSMARYRSVNRSTVAMNLPR